MNSHYQPSVPISRQGVIGDFAGQSSDVPTEPITRVYSGHVDERGNVVYPGLNAPGVDHEAIRQQENLARLGVVGQTAVPSVIDPATLHQLGGDK